MREIKFRVWDKENGRFVSHFTIQEYFEQIVLGLKFIKHNLVFQQFTGFHDKNDKEIYEGDIIHGYWYDKSRIATTIFEKGSFWIKGSDMIGNTEGFQFLLGDFSMLDSIRLAFSGIEIVGNIYENPELLKDKMNKIKLPQRLWVCKKNKGILHTGDEVCEKDEEFYIIADKFSYKYNYDVHLGQKIKFEEYSEVLKLIGDRYFLNRPS